MVKRRPFGLGSPSDDASGRWCLGGEESPCTDVGGARFTAALHAPNCPNTWFALGTRAPGEHRSARSLMSPISPQPASVTVKGVVGLLK